MRWRRGERDVRTAMERQPNAWRPAGVSIDPPQQQRRCSEAANITRWARGVLSACPLHVLSSSHNEKCSGFIISTLRVRQSVHCSQAKETTFDAFYAGSIGRRRSCGFMLYREIFGMTFKCFPTCRCDAKCSTRQDRTQVRTRRRNISTYSVLSWQSLCRAAVL